MELWQGLVARLSLSSPDITKAMRALHRMVFVRTVPVAREFHPLQQNAYGVRTFRTFAPSYVC